MPMSLSNEVGHPYTTEEVAEILRISKTSVLKLGRQGVLVAIPTGLRLRRWRRYEVDRLVGQPATADS